MTTPIGIELTLNEARELRRQYVGDTIKNAIGKTLKILIVHDNATLFQIGGSKNQVFNYMSFRQPHPTTKATKVIIQGI